MAWDLGRPGITATIPWLQLIVYSNWCVGRKWTVAWDLGRPGVGNEQQPAALRPSSITAVRQEAAEDDLSIINDILVITTH